MNLTNKEMSKVEGGSTLGVIAALGAGLVYLIGVLSGYTNPNKCNNKR